MVIWPKMWLVTVALAGNLAFSLTMKWPFAGDRWKSSYSLLFANFLFVPATVALGVAYAIDPSPLLPRHPHAFAVWTDNGMFIASIALGIYCVCRMKGLRWFALSVTLIAIWMLFWAGLFAGMSLSGDWL